MGKTRKPRSDAKMYQLPQDIRDSVNDLLINDNMSYSDLIAWLGEKGYKISKSSLSTYAFKVFDSAQRIADDLEKTKHIISIIGKNPDVDTAKATTAILKSGLLKKISSAEEEFSEMSVEKAGKLFIQLSKAESSANKVQFDMRTKIDLAFEKMENEILETIGHNPVLAPQLHEIFLKAQKAATAENNTD